MNINNIKRRLENADIWYSCLTENDDINIVEVTDNLYLQSEMHRKLFVLTKNNIKQAEKLNDWSLFVNVMLDSACTKYLSRLNSLNLIIVSGKDIGRAVSVLNEAMH